MKSVGIVGLGRVGRTLVNYFMDKDVRMLLYDENPRVFLHRSVAFALREGRAERLDDPAKLSGAELLIKSPGISNQTPWIQELDSSGVEIIDEIEFVWKELGRPRTIAVTGTNGKSTTTAWTAEVLKAAGFHVFCGGNIAPGRPFSEALSEPRYEAYVIEVSTFQLERTPSFRPDIGVLLNVTADHLNRHSPAEYADLKLSLFKNHTQDDHAVLNADDETIQSRLGGIKGRHTLFSLSRTDADACLRQGTLYMKNVPLIAAEELSLPGLHNVSNALAAVAVAGILGAKPDAVRTGLLHFKGLPHRMQYLGELRGRPVYNNSMCTNPTAFYHSVHAFAEPSVVIAGGTEKHLPLDGFIAGVRERARFLVLFGENAARLKEILETKLNFSSCIIVDSLRAALDAALENSRPGERILFCPGFASFGNFKNFEERGHAFIKAFRETRT